MTLNVAPAHVGEIQLRGYLPSCSRLAVREPLGAGTCPPYDELKCGSLTEGCFKRATQPHKCSHNRVGPP